MFANHIDKVIHQINIIFNKDQEFITIGMPFIKSTIEISKSYSICDNIDRKFINDPDYMITYIREGLFALCQIWFESRPVHKEFIGNGLSIEEFEICSNFLYKFLEDTNTDTSTLNYKDYLQ